MEHNIYHPNEDAVLGAAICSICVAPQPGKFTGSSENTFKKNKFNRINRINMKDILFNPFFNFVYCFKKKFPRGTSQTDRSLNMSGVSVI